MDAQAIASEILSLRKRIRVADYAYYVLDQPVVTDAEYDGLMRHLAELEKAHPALRTSNSPTNRVGGTPSDRPSKWAGSDNEASSEPDVIITDPCPECGDSRRWRLTNTCPTCADREYRRRRRAAVTKAKKSMVVGAPCEMCTCVFRHASTNKCVVCAEKEALQRYNEALGRLGEHHRRVIEKAHAALPRRRVKSNLAEGMRIVVTVNEEETVHEIGEWLDFVDGPVTLTPFAFNYYDRNAKRIRAWHELYAAARRSYDQRVSRKNNRSYRAAAVGATGSYTVPEMDVKAYRLGWVCFYCGGPYEHDDHFFPLSTSRDDSLSNIVPACEICNAAKHNQDPWAWMEEELRHGRLTNPRLRAALKLERPGNGKDGLAALVESVSNMQLEPDAIPTSAPVRIYRLRRD